MRIEICCLNNYPLRKMIEQVDAGVRPAQHAWGIDGLSAAGHRLHVAPFREPGNLRILGTATEMTHGLVGQIDQEIWAYARRPDAYYAADQRSLRGIALLRAGIARNRFLVSVLHHALTDRDLASLTRHDAILALGCYAAELASHRLKRNTVQLVRWGPDLDSPLYSGAVDGGRVISAGKSNRDLHALVEAIGSTHWRGLVYDLQGQLKRSPHNVEIVHPGGEGSDPMSPSGYLTTAVLDYIRNASIVAIPIEDTNRLTGLTELNDALALGKPIVITRSPFLPFDVEKIGCGISVPPGDASAWSNALRALEDASIRREMGANGRRFAEQHWNYNLFREEVRGIFSR